MKENIFQNYPKQRPRVTLDHNSDQVYCLCFNVLKFNGFATSVKYKYFFIVPKNNE